MPLIWLTLFAGVVFGIAMLLKPKTALPSAPVLYASYVATATIFGGIIMIGLASMISGLPIEIAAIATLLIAITAVLHSLHLQAKQRRARAGFEQLLLLLLVAAAAVAIFTTIGIIVTVSVESIQFFQHISVTEFLFGTTWSPQIAIREDQTGAQGAFGFIPLLTGTMLITAIAMTLAVPCGLIIAVYLSNFAHPTLRKSIKPILEMLAGVPTVVYGFFALAILSPMIRDLAQPLGIQIAGESALIAGTVIGVMLLPFITSLSEDALFAVPDSMLEGALALGATRYETAFDIAIPAALPGIVAGILLALSRAIGETMIVVMAAGISANLSINPLEAVTTITVQIVTLLTGDQTFDDPKTLAAFALGLTLFVITLMINLIAVNFVRRHEQYYD